MERYIIFLFFILVHYTNSKSLDTQWYDGLQADSHSWYDQVADVKQPNIFPYGCDGKPADVYIVMDTSDDVSPEQLQEQKAFASKLVTLFYKKKDTVRVGVVSFGDRPITVVRSGVFSENQQLSDVIQSIPIIGGKRHTGKVLDYLRKKVFSSFGSRQEVGHVAIMVTNGYSVSSKQTSLMSKLLKKKGVYIYSVSVGKSRDTKELSNMVSYPSHQYMFTNNNQITQSLIDLLHIKECDYQVHPPSEVPVKACDTIRPVDILFGADYLGLGTRTSSDVISLIYDTLQEFSGDVLTGLISGKSSGLNFKNQLMETNELQEKIDDIKFSDLADILKRIRRTFARGRKNVQKTAVIFLNDDVDITKKALIEAKRNKFMKIETYIVYIGLKYDMKKLNMLSNGYNQDNILIFPTLTDLLTKKLQVITNICRGL